MSTLRTQRTRAASRLAWSLFALTVALGLGILPLFVAVTLAASAAGTPLPTQTVAPLDVSAIFWIETPLVLLAKWTLSALGALIVSRPPTHAIGWIFCAVGFLLVAEEFAGYYAIYALIDARGALPGGLLAGWFQNWIWVVSLALLGAFVPLLFPTGRLVSRRWRPAFWLATAATLAGVCWGVWRGILAGATRQLAGRFGHLQPPRCRGPRRPAQRARCRGLLLAAGEHAGRGHLLGRAAAPRAGRRAPAAQVVRLRRGCLRAVLRPTRARARRAGPAHPVPRAGAG